MKRNKKTESAEEKKLTVTLLLLLSLLLLLVGYKNWEYYKTVKYNISKLYSNLKCGLLVLYLEFIYTVLLS